MNESPFEIDHVFVAVDRGASEVDELLAVGFEEGPMNVHRGGTACRRLRLRIELDRGRRGRSLSLSPAAPLEVIW